MFLLDRSRDATFGEVRGAMLIYCAGCFLALQPHMQSVAERIRRGLPSHHDGEPLPFACGFTFGEQGPIGGKESTHGNLMFNICLFGGPKSQPSASDGGFQRSESPPTSPLSPSSSSKKASLYKRVRQFLLHPSRFHSMSHILAEFDADGDSTITPKEFHDTLLRFGFDISDEERALLIDAIDGDGDGYISYTELFVYLQGGGTAAS